MGEYIYEANGKRYKVKADTEAEAYSKFVEAVPQDKNPAVLPDMGKGLRSGVSQGASNLLGTPGSIYDAVQQGVGYAGNRAYKAITGDEPTRDGTEGFVERMFAPNERGRYGYENPVTGPKIRNKVADLSHGMSEYRPKTLPGKIANTTGRNLPGVASAIGTSSSMFDAANKAMQFAVAPAVGEELAVAGTQKFVSPRLPEKYRGPAEGAARVLGAFSGPFAYEKGVNRMITPYKAPNAVHQRHVKRMEDEGVELSAGQKLNNVGLQRKEVQKNNNTTGDDFFERQNSQFTKAVTSKIPGFGADQITDEWVDQAGRRIGSDFDSLSRSTVVRADAQLVQGSMGILRGYKRSIEQRDYTKDVEETLKDIMNSARNNGGIIPGADYQSIRSSASDAMRAAYRSGNYKTGTAIKDVIETMDDAMERTMTFGRPDLVRDWREVRRNWRNYITIVDAASAPGKTSGLSSGYITPEQLRGAVGRIEGGRSGVAKARGPLRNLAVSGQAAMKLPNTSGTAENQAAMNTLLRAGAGGGVGGYVGAGAATAVGLPPWVGAGPGALVGGKIGQMAGDAMLSPAGIKYQTNQLIPPQSNSQIARQGLIPSFLAAQDQVVEGGM